ncbi:MAG: hypothetical protein JST42_20130 [Bacteroidetes bacterium]|nr:hypothetical protein [Bacteroidota bacterium]
MKILHLLLAGALILSSTAGHAQPDSARITQKALLFADSLMKTDWYESWTAYANLAPASVIKFYGGKDGYIEHIQKLRGRTKSDQAEDDPQLKMLNLMVRDEQWQCVIRMSRWFHKDGTRYHQITYFIGQSKDEGESWKLFDVSYNRVSNIIYMFPEINGDLPIEEPTIMSEEQEIALQKKAEADAAAAKKVVKKK